MRIVTFTLCMMFLSACSSVEERQKNAQEAVHQAAGAAASAGAVVEENVSGFTAYVADSIDWMKRMLAKMNYRARKLEEGIEKVQEAREAFGEAVGKEELR